MKTHLFSILGFLMLWLSNPLTAQTLVRNTVTDFPVLQIGTQNARFPDLTQYLSDYLLYPEQARQNNVEGQVTVEIQLGEKGEILSVSLVQGIGFGCDEALMELVSNMPNWVPASKNGRHVPQKVLIRTQFRLQ